MNHSHERQKSARTKEQMGEFRALLAKRIREGLPKKVLMERTGASSTLIDVVAAEIGVPLARFCDWEGA